MAAAIVKHALRKLRRLTGGETDHDHPVFSPDGRWIVLSAGTLGATDLYLVDRRGRFGRRLTDGPGHKTSASFAPDGSRIAYCVRPATGAPWEVVLLDLDPSARPVRLLHAGGDGGQRTSFKQPAFSPDGRRLAYFSDEGTPRNFHVFLLDLESRRRDQLTNDLARNDCHPAWSPDGRRLAFHAYEGLEADRANIYVLDLHGGAPEAVTDRPGLAKHPVFIDDRRILFHREEPGAEPALHVVDRRRGREARLSPPGRADKQPDVARTRKGRIKVVFASRGEGAAGGDPRGPAASPFDVWSAEIDGG